MFSDEILKRFFKNFKFTDDEWDGLNSDITEGQPVSFICQKYGIKKSYLKAYKKYYLGE